MSKKRLFALLVAVFMLIALFSACAQTEETSDPDDSTADDTNDVGTNDADDATD